MDRFSATIGVTLTNKELVKEVMAEKDFEHMKLENQLCFAVRKLKGNDETVQTAA